MDTPIKKAFDLAGVAEGETIYVACDVSGATRFDDVAAQFKNIALACIAHGVKRVVVCTFDASVLEVFDVTGNFHVLTRVKGLQCGGGTNIAAPLTFVRNHDGPQGVRKVFVFTDGFFDHRGMLEFDHTLSFILTDGKIGGPMERHLSKYGNVVHVVAPWLNESN
jgi:hypothetical protein